MTHTIVARGATLGAWPTAGAAIIVALAVGLGVALGGTLFSAAFVAVIIMALVLLAPELGVVLLIVQFFFLGSLVTLGYLPHSAIWLPDIIIGALVIRALALSRGGTRGLVAPRPLLVACIALVVLCVASSVINGQSVIGLFIGLRFYLKYPLLFFALLNSQIKPKFYTKLMAGFIVIAAVQIPVSAFQYARYGHVAEANAGTMDFSGGQNLLFLVLTAMTLLLALVLLGKRGLAYAVLAMGMFVPLILAGVRASFVYVPVAYVLVVVRALLLDVKRFSGTAIRASLVAGAVGGLVFTSSLLSSAIAENSYSGVGGIIRRESETSMEGTGRITAVRSAASMIAGSPSTSLVGFGPGSANTSRFAYGRLNESATFRLARSQVSATLLELGWAGIAGLAVIIWMAWRITTRTRFGHGGMGDAIMFSGPLVVLYFALMQGYFAAWTGGNATPLLFWLLLAAVYVVDHAPTLTPAEGVLRRGD